MKTSTRLMLASVLLAGVAAVPAAAQDASPVWSVTSGLAMPESVSYDPDTRTLFVSNINNPDFGSQNGQGYITQLGLDGSVVKEKFVDGLNGPKGTAVANGKLYVSSQSGLVEIDIASAKVTNTYAAEGATFLNDPAVGPDGTVYVSETMQGAIYRLQNGQLTQWVKDPMVAGANGLVVADGKLIEAGLGDMSGGFQNMKPTTMAQVDLQSGQVSNFGGNDPVGNMDGLEAYGDGSYLVSDNPTGKIIRVWPDGKHETVLEIGKGGAADFEYVADDHLVIVPMTQTSEVLAYKIGGM